MANDIKSVFEKRLLSALKTRKGIRPELYVYAGLPDKNMIKEVRRNVPEGTFLLYLFQYEKGPDIFEYDSDPFVLTLALDENLSSALIWLATGALRIERYHFSRSAEFPPDVAEKLLGIVDSAVVDVANEKNYGLLKLRSAIQNIPLILNDYENSWVPLEKEFPVLVCGAGPSLKEQIKLIRSFQDKIIIIAAGRTGIILKNAGIEPDFIVYADAEGLGETVTDEKNILVALTSISNKKALSFGKRIWTEGDSIYFNRFMLRNGLPLGRLSFSGTSTVTAIDLAMKLDPSGIALTGNDYCLSEQGDFHADSSGAEETYKGDIFRIPGNDSESVPTIRELELLRKSLESYLLETDAEIFNCTRGGARVSGMKRMTLEGFLEEYAAASNKGTVQLFKKINPQKIADIAVLKKGVKEFEDAADIYARDIQDCRAFCDTSCDDDYRKLRKDILEDIRKDLEYINGSGKATDYQSRIFSAFRNFAISLVARGNPKFAEFLEKRHEFKIEIPHRISSRSQEYPIIEISDGKTFIKLNDSNNLIAEAIAKFRESRGFEPDNSAVVIPAGGNWNYAVEFARTFPSAKLLIVEALPGIFSEAIDIAMFTQYFRRDTAIIGAHPDIPDWETLVHEKLAEFKQAGRKLFCFIPPHIAKIPALEENSDIVRRAVRKGA